MSALNLIPDSYVVVAQGAVFLTNAYVVKKLLLEPYLDVRRKRDALTKNAKEDALSSLGESDQKARQIEAKLREAHQQAQNIYQVEKDKAVSENQRVIQDATAASEKRVKEIRQAVQASYLEEEKKVKATAESLVAEAYPVLVH